MKFNLGRIRAFNLSVYFAGVNGDLLVIDFI